MPIKDFGKNTRIKPVCTVQVGATVPVGCKKPAIYAESPNETKCVNALDGECVHWRKTKANFGGKNDFCPAAGLNEKQLKNKNINTKPVQLGFFLIPKFYREAVGIPDRPTEIPGIILASHDLKAHPDETGRIVSVEEPIEVIERYPILDYNLMQWRATELVCKGDGENAHCYPASPENEKHMAKRVCGYKECPDYKNKKCKESAELFFRVPKSPGFPAMWRYQTRSAKAISYLIQELRDIHHVLGHVSLIPLTLTLEKETGTPLVPRKGDGGKKEYTRMKTEVYRVHIRTGFTMIGAADAKRDALTFISGGTQEVKMLKESTSDVAPPHEPPVEMHATAPQKDWKEEAAPAPSPTPTPDAAPAPDKPAAKTEITKEDRFAEIEQATIKDIESANTVEVLRLIPAHYKDSLSGIGMKSTAEDKVVAAYRSKMQFLKENSSAPPAKEAEKPAPQPAKPAQKPTGGLSAVQKREQLHDWIYGKQPTVPKDIITIVGKDSFEKLTDEDVTRIYELAKSAQKSK